MDHVLASRVIVRRIDELRENPGNARVHSGKQIADIARLIKRFGWTNPVLISADDIIVAGHGRVAAARKLGMAEAPTICLSHLNADELRAYALADNRIAEQATWDNELLSIDFQYLTEIDFDLTLTGFEMAEVDLILCAGGDAKAEAPEPAIPPLAEIAVTRAGDLWVIGSHRLICGDAQEPATYKSLLDDEPADMLFTDPPYNVPIDGHVSGLGKHKHREFAFAAGEMSRAEFTLFLAMTLACSANALRDGAIAYCCMDWRHMKELLDAGELMFGPMKQLCVWNKTNAGMGSFYRSKHELVFVFKKGDAPHINNFSLGEKGRYRTNVWDYAGMSSMSATRDADLAAHPTVKPVQLVQDAILDCSNRGGVILDSFGGSGTTLIAAERVGRKARLIEIDPLYCDTIIRRAELLVGLKAFLAADGRDFAMVAAERISLLEAA
jgi:DNA modification methylase